MKLVVRFYYVFLRQLRIILRMTRRVTDSVVDYGVENVNGKETCRYFDLSKFSVVQFGNISRNS